MSSTKQALDRLTDMSGALFTELNIEIGDAATVQKILTRVKPALLSLATDAVNRDAQVENEGVRGALNRLMEYERLRELHDDALLKAEEIAAQMDDLATYPDMKTLCDALKSLGIEIGTTKPKKERK